MDALADTSICRFDLVASSSYSASMAILSLPHVLILGCGRSGTSIFGELFDELPQYVYSSEPDFDEVMRSDFSTPLASKVPRESDAYPAQPGLSIPVDTFLKHAPKAKLFWIVRHPLDAICSLRIGIANDWGHHPRPPDWKDWLDRSLVEQCAHHWSFLNTYGYRQIRDVACVVHFEDMIVNPRQFATKICSEIGLGDSEETREQFSHWAGRVQNSNNDHFVEAETSRHYSRPDHEKRVGRWQENLTRKEAKQIWPIVSVAAADFGYPAPTGR